MYPLYWTPDKEGIFIGYSHELKALGYNGLVHKKKCRKSKKPDMKKKTIKPKTYTQTKLFHMIYR